MTKLVNVEKVLRASAFTGVSKAIAPVAATRSSSVNGGGIGPDLAELGDYFWNVIPLVNLEIRVMAPYMVQERGFKKVALIYVDDPAGARRVHEGAEGRTCRRPAARWSASCRSRATRSSSPRRRQGARV